MATHDSPLSAARWLVAVAASVVVAFVAATSIAQWVQRAITTRANDIIDNAMPSVKLLSAARGDVERMERAIARATATGDLPGYLAAADEARQNIEEEVASYRALPYFPREPALFAPVTAALGALDHDYAAWKAAPSPALLHDLRRDAAAVDTALERSVDFDAEQGQRLGLEIERIRGSSQGLLWVLEAIAVVLSAGVIVLGLRQLRRVAAAGRRELEARDRREAELAERNEALGEFAGRVAHDILTPIGTVALAFQLVRTTSADDPRALRAIDRGLAATDRAHALVDGLLAFARAGGKPEAGSAADVAASLRELLDVLRRRADDRGIAMSATSLPAGQVACSPGVLTSVVTNLVQNAIKYMPETSADKRIDVRVEDAGAMWHLEVQDTGTGIAEDQQQQIFEPHVKLAGGEGIGLGLATVDRLVRAHGGKLGVRSKLGEGSTFWVDLPKPPAAAPARDEATSGQPRAG